MLRKPHASVLTQGSLGGVPGSTALDASGCDNCTSMRQGKSRDARTWRTRSRTMAAAAARRDAAASGPNVWHDSPAAAMAGLEELEETARLALLAGLAVNR